MIEVRSRKLTQPFFFTNPIDERLATGRQKNEKRQSDMVFDNESFSLLASDHICLSGIA
jgi:hypothetical protein